MTHAVSWDWPALTLWYGAPLTLTVQAFLLLTPSASTASSRATRLALLPLALYAIWHACDTYFTPRDHLVFFNVVVHLSKTWACLRSIEFAAVEQPYRWIGYDEAYRPKDMKQQKKDDDEQSKNEFPASFGERIFWAVSCVCSLRGIGWSWGIKGSDIPRVHPQASESSFVTSLVIRIIWAQAICALSIGTAVYIHQHGGQQAAIQQLLATYTSSSGKSPTLAYAIGWPVSIACFGAAIYATLEQGYSLLTLTIYLLTALLRLSFPQSLYLRPRTFEKRAWPRLMIRPYAATSLRDLWGKRWHALFKRQFVALGYKPLASVAKRAGLGKSAQAGCGVLGAFAISGILHESFNDATPWYPPDRHRQTFVFFFVQGIALAAESLCANLAKGSALARRWPGGLSAFAWLLVSGKLMADCWLERGLVDRMPPVESWEWWRWTVPLAFIFPRLQAR